MARANAGVYLAALLIAGCVGPTGLEPAANTPQAAPPLADALPDAELMEGRVTITVPAGEWATLQLLFEPEQANNRWLGVVFGWEPGRGATPYVGVATVTSFGWPRLLFAAGNETDDAGSAWMACFGDCGGGGREVGWILILGSEDGPTTFHVGGSGSGAFPSATSGADVLRKLRDRTQLPAGADHAGTGGWAGTAVVYHSAGLFDSRGAAFTNGRAYTNMTLGGPPLSDFGAQLAIVGPATGGMAAALGYSLLETGTAEWTARAALPPLFGNYSARDLRAGGFPAVAPQAGVAPLWLWAQAANADGTIRVAMDQAGTATEEVLVLTGGWTSADLNALYDLGMEDALMFPEPILEESTDWRLEVTPTGSLPRIQWSPAGTP